MKKLFVSIIGISLLALVGASTAVALTVSNKNVEETKADYVYPRYTGLFERIEDPSSIELGDKVFLATKSGYVLEGVGGNPAYAHGDSGGVSMFGNATYDPDYNDYIDRDDTKLLWLENKVAVELTVSEPADEYKSLPYTFSFKSDFIIGGSHKYNGHYLAENDEENYQGRHDYETIGWFLNGFGIRPYLDGKSTWQLTYKSDTKQMLIRKCIYDDLTSYICYDYNGARHRFCFGSEANAQVNLYRRVDASKIFRPAGSTTPIREPNQISYRLGEKVAYDGMVVNFGIGTQENYDSYNLKYCGQTSSLFSNPVTITSLNQSVTLQIFSGDSVVQYTLPITITDNASNNHYQMINSVPKDYRGTYLFADPSDKIFDASKDGDVDKNYVTREGVYENGLIVAETIDEYHPGSEIDRSTLKIVRTEIDGNYYYHAKNIYDKYLSIGTKIEGYDEYYFDYSDNATTANAVTLESTTLKIGEYYLSQKESKAAFSYGFTKNYDSLGVFKIDTGTNFIVEEVSNFIDIFEGKTQVCEFDVDPGFEKISDDLWNEIKVEFEKLGPDAQGVFANTTYTHGTASLKTKENVADRYDYILAKYNKEDFMLRKEANTYENSLSNNAVILNSDNNSSLILVIVLSVLSFASIGGLIIIKKRKHQ